MLSTYQCSPSLALFHQTAVSHVRDWCPIHESCRCTAQPPSQFVGASLILPSLQSILSYHTAPSKYLLYILTYFTDAHAVSLLRLTSCSSSYSESCIQFWPPLLCAIQGIRTSFTVTSPPLRPLGHSIKRYPSACNKTAFYPPRDICWLPLSTRVYTVGATSGRHFESQQQPLLGGQPHLPPDSCVPTIS